MRAEYRYDLDDLGETHRNLGRLRSDYEGASQAAEDVEGSLGYDSLRGAVEEFVDNWKKHREKQLATMEETETALADICEGYVEFDESGVTQLVEGTS